VKLIVGLGNPGTKYRNTRHNLGFRVLEALAETLGARFDKEKHQGLIAMAEYHGQPLMLIKPMTYMNLSGDCVAPLARQKAREAGDILVVVDDIHLPVGRLRMRPEGSAGGHNGLKSLIERLGTKEFPRLRMGVGSNENAVPLPNHVLGTFHPAEYEAVNEMVERAVKAALRWVEADPQTVMNEFN